MNTWLHVILAALLVTSVTALPFTYSQDGQLHIIDASSNVLEAVFFTGDMGIHISSDSNSLSVVSLVDHEVLVSGRKPQGSSSKLTSVMGNTFLQYSTTGPDGESRRADYSVPKLLVEETKEALEAGKEDRMTSLLGEQNEAETRLTVGTAFEHLFQRSELALLENASIALGRVGIMGSENQGALNFYGVAMTLVKQLYRLSDGSGQHESRDRDDEEDRAGVPGESEGSRFKRWFGYEWCDYSWSYCRSGSCIQGYSSCNGLCTDWPGCTGRCGPGCWWCWWFVCSNCCYNHGCYEHDVCCDTYGYLSLQCLNVLGFSCSGFSC